MLLQHLTRQAINAHNGTSHTPEKRGAQLINDYSEELQSDMDELQNEGIAEDIILEYKQRYERNLTSWLYAKSNCLSTMIAGPSKFPVRRAEKANRSEDRHYQVFRNWRERAKKAIVRKSLPPKTVSSELDRYRLDLESMKRNQEVMKSCNAIIRKALKSGKDCIPDLVAAGLSEANARELLKPGGWWGVGFAPFSLTNNNANIHRVEGMIKMLEEKEKNAQNIGEVSYKFPGGTVVVNYTADRVQIINDEKPGEEIRRSYKSAGFVWSPSNKAWQRKVTPVAIYKANALTGAGIPQ